MWKAFAEMEELGWIGSGRPRMFCVQSTGCAPMVRAWENGWEDAGTWEDAVTYAAGLRVPGAVGDFLILRGIRESGGRVVAVPDTEMREWVDRMGPRRGSLPRPRAGRRPRRCPGSWTWG